MPAWGDIFGSGSLAEQFLIWNVGSELVSALLAPVLTAVQADMWKGALAASDGTLFAPVPPADYADWVVRNIIAQGDAESGAGLSGINSADFDRMVKNAGEPPGLEFILQAYRRGFIPFAGGDPTTPSVETGVRTGRVYDYWLPIIQDMLLVPISPSDAVSAVLRQQISLAEGQAEAYASGINTDRFQILLDSAGRPPGPTELVEFVRRGLIPFKGTGPDALTFEQGIYEGDSKDKWEPLYEKLTDYIPPPRTITTLQSHGQLTTDQATALYQENGLSPELAAIYAASAVSTKVSAATQLTESNVLKLYAEQVVTAAQATAMLANLGTPAEVAAYLLELQDFNRAAAAYNSAVSRVGTLYTGRHIGRGDAVGALNKLDVPADGQTHLLSIWDQELAVNIKSLTAAQIAGAFLYSVISQEAAQGKLEAIGYSAYDAWVLLSVEAKGLLPDEPSFGSVGGGATPLA